MPKSVLHIYYYYVPTYIFLFKIQNYKDWHQQRKHRDTHTYIYIYIYTSKYIYNKNKKYRSKKTFKQKQTCLIKFQEKY